MTTQYGGHKKGFNTVTLNRYSRHWPENANGLILVEKVLWHCIQNYKYASGHHYHTLSIVSWVSTYMKDNNI